MSNQTINFLYDPARQGYDTQTWSLLSGITPVASSGVLEINSSTIYHYGDCVRGDFVINLNIPNAPKNGDSRIFGLYSYSQGAYLIFNITNAVFSAQANDATNTNTTNITWQSAWTGTNTEFRIKWEPGLAYFYVGGAWQATISTSSATGNPTCIPGGPMALYISNSNSDNLNMEYIRAQGIQSFFMNTPISGSVVINRPIRVSDSLKITESITTTGTLGDSSVSDSLTNTESITINVLFLFVSVNDPLTTTESIQMDNFSVSVNDALTNTESITIRETGIINVSDSLTNTESITINVLFLFVNVNDSLTNTEFVQLPF